MANLNNSLQIFNTDSLDLNQALQDYTTDTNDEHNDDLLTSTLIESKYYDMENLTTYLNQGEHNRNQLRILHLNIQSLSAKYDKLKENACI